MNIVISRNDNGIYILGFLGVETDLFPHQASARFLEDLHGQRIGVVARIVDGHDVGVDKHLGADGARLMGAVQLSAPDGDTMVRRLDDGVLLRMEPAAELVPLAGRDPQFVTQTPSLLAVDADLGGRRCIPWPVSAGS